MLLAFEVLLETIPSFLLIGLIMLPEPFLAKIMSVFWHNDGRDCMPILMRFGKKVLMLKVSSTLTVGELKMIAAKHFVTEKIDGIINGIVLRSRDKLLHCDELTITNAGISSGCEVQCSLHIRGGSGSSSVSIPTQNLRQLMLAIKSDFEAWIKDKSLRYPKRFEKDPLEGKDVVWDGFSGSIQHFFKTEEINPLIKYKHLYSSQRHTIAVSYVWMATKISGIAGVTRTCIPRLNFSDLKFSFSLLSVFR